MKEILVLSSSNYPNSDTTNYGDCILINTGQELIIYDCGHEEHAKAAIQYMDAHHFEKALFILSHNDSDHFDGLPKLLKENRISKIRTTLLLKYTKEILDAIDDHRKSKDSVTKQILEIYDNIAKLSGAPIEDIFEEPDDLCKGVKIVGPDFDYMIETVAQRLDGRDGNTVDDETAVNATSIQADISFDNDTHMLLSGDSSYAAIEDKVHDYQCLQLPHHGKPKQAEKIFEKNRDKVDVLYIVSDNTGTSNGGSDNLNTTGHRVLNTKMSDNVVITKSLLSPTSIKTGHVLGV